MPFIDEHNQPASPVEDHRSKPRWSANKKMDALRLRGESLNQLSREFEVEAHRRPRGVTTSSSTGAKG